MLNQAVNLRRPAIATPAMTTVADESDAWMQGKGMRHSVGRDAVLFREGDPARCCYKILSGAVRMVKVLADGRRYIADFFLPGDVVGLDAAGNYEFTAEAIVDSMLVRHARSQIDTQFDANPQAGRRLLDVTLQRLAAAQNQMLLLGRMNAMERVANFLLTLERRLGCRKAGRRTIPLAMTRADIADHLGLTLETVSRMLNQLKREGVITLADPHEIGVAKPERLEHLACAGGH
jgi:CRP-like cAMP-binding protein